MASTFLASDVTPVNGWKLENCKWGTLPVTYYEDSSLSTADTPSVGLAALAWNDVPSLLTITQVSSQSNNNDIVVSSINDASKSWDGQTVYSCSPSGFVTPVSITLNDYQLNLEINVNQLAAGYQDLAMSVAGHEMGHAFGLDHSQVQQSLMWYSSTRWFNYRIFVPVVDDVRALAGVYGWAQDTSFSAEVYPPNSAPCSSLPCYPPYYLTIPSPSPTFTETFVQSALPSSHLALMFAYVTPITLHRFHMGWEKYSNDPTDTLNRYATLELDDDGAKFVSVTNGGATTTIQTFVGSNQISASSSYFLELLVECCSELKATAFAFMGSPFTSNGGEVYLGNFDSGSGIIDGWTSANYFDTSVWTGSSDPASNYQVNEFWNFQSGPKQPPPSPGGGGGGGSVAQGTEILTPNGNIAVQNLNVGDTVISIDPFTQQSYHSTIRRINIVTVDNMLIFHTATGLPLRVDINPRLRFNAIHNGLAGLWSTVLLVPGDSLYQSGYGWTTITRVDRIYGGLHTYYDLHLDPLHDYIANGYADCPCKT